MIHEMSGADARFLLSETPSVHMHTLKVATLDVSSLGDAFDAELFITTVDERIRSLPPLLRRPVPMPHGRGHPVWVDDESFDVHRHASWRRASPPGGTRELAAVVADVAATPLPRDRPLWEVVLVEGLAGGRVAVVAKVHHAVADGAAAVAMLEHVVDGGAAVPAPALGPDGEPTDAALRAVARAARRRKVMRFPRLAATVAARSTRAAVSRWRQPALAPKPFDGPHTPLNRSLTPARTFAMTTLSLERMLATRRAAGTSLNDVYLATCAGALREYLLALGALPDRPLVASVPIAIQGLDPHLHGNRVDNMYVAIPVELADPRARLEAIHASALAARSLRDVMGSDIVERRAELTPTHAYPFALHALEASHAANHLRPPVNLVISNVAGPRERLHLAGATLDAMHSVGPILEGVGANITAWSYAGGMHVAALGCPTSLPDPWALVDRLEPAMDELARAVGAPEVA